MATKDRVMRRAQSIVIPNGKFREVLKLTHDAVQQRCGDSRARKLPAPRIGIPSRMSALQNRPGCVPALGSGSNGGARA